MKKIIFILSTVAVFYFPSNSYSQEEKLEVEGAIQIANSEDPTPDAGTIRWTGCDFEGWDGFNWLSLTGKTTVNDIDGNTYNTVEIDGVVWMAENLRTTKFKDGTPIQYLSSNTAWANDTNGAYSYPNGSLSNVDDYGLLYNYYAVEPKDPCPVCWKIPSDQQRVDLVSYLAANNLTGGDFKETGLQYWKSPNTGATNSLGFNLRGTALRSSSGTYFAFQEGSSFWHASYNASGPYLSFSYDSVTISQGISGKNWGRPVRCVKEQ